MAETKAKSKFDILNSVNVSDKTEKKNGLTYLSWAWAWGEVKKKFPEANYRVVKNEDGWIYHTDGRTCWVEVSVTIDDLEHMEVLPVMDYRNNSIPLEKITSMDAIKAIQRAITKACARHGLGLYIYAGEDLPEDENHEEENKSVKTAPKRQAKSDVKNDVRIEVVKCSKCSKEITDYAKYSAREVIEESTKRLGKPTCMKCWIEMAEAKKKKMEENGNA